MKNKLIDTNFYEFFLFTVFSLEIL